MPYRDLSVQARYTDPRVMEEIRRRQREAQRAVMMNPFGGYDPAANVAAVQPGTGVVGLAQNRLEADARNPKPTLMRAAEATMAVPVIGDITGFANDAATLIADPESRTPLNLGLTIAGALPFVPGMTVLRKGADAVDAPPRERVLGEVVGTQGTRAPVNRNRTRFRGGRRRSAYPGIYGDAGGMVDDVPVAPESPNLPELFGVTRSDLSQGALARDSAPGGWTGAADARERGLWLPPGTPANPRGAATAEAIMTPSNRDRLQALWEAARTGRPDLYTGMTGWYNLDPMYNRMVELYGPDEGIRRFQRLSTMLGMASPGSDVLLELNRGSRAHWLANKGEFDDFVRRGGQPGDSMTVGGLPGRGHPYHSTAHALPMGKYLDTGAIQSKEPKVPTYVQAGMPTDGPTVDLSFQSHLPVGDAHWSRLVGLADVRPSELSFGKSASGPEMLTLSPWYDDAAHEVGLTGVTGQSLHWGLAGPQTGVTTPVGAPKLELIADEIKKTADALGRPAPEVRDAFLRGDLPIGAIDPNLLIGMGGASALTLGGLGLNEYFRED